MVDDPSTEELKRRQADKERTEREGVTESMTEAEAAAHRRRAEKAEYLRQKLAERERAEAETSEDE